jgi:hypothetical protein
MRLLDNSSNIHSQTGEDGILAKVLELMPSRNKWCVEFGAWDGQHLSNTCNLIENQSYSAILIEGSKRRFADLKKRHGTNPRVITLNRFVGFNEGDNLDVLIGNTPIPKNFDLLSIDIDGNDYHVWNSIVSYVPKVVCIEYNPTIPTEVEFVQPADQKINQGASLLALTKLAKRKNYELIAVTPLNAIFVHSGYFQFFGIIDNAPRVLREDVSAITHIFCGYDGTIFIVGAQSLLWHDIPYKTRIRQLPKIFRIYPGNFRFINFKMFRLYRKLFG